MTYDVEIYGASDDLIEIEGDAPGCDEYSAEIARFLVFGGDERVTELTVCFNSEGLWSISAAPPAEAAPMLPVHIRSSAVHPHSAVAEIAGVAFIRRIA